MSHPENAKRLENSNSSTRNENGRGMNPRPTDIFMSFRVEAPCSEAYATPDDRGFEFRISVSAAACFLLLAHSAQVDDHQHLVPVGVPVHCRHDRAHIDISQTLVK